MTAAVLTTIALVRNHDELAGRGIAHEIFIDATVEKLILTLISWQQLHQVLHMHLITNVQASRLAKMISSSHAACFHLFSYSSQSIGVMVLSKIRVMVIASNENDPEIYLYLYISYAPCATASPSWM